MTFDTYRWFEQSHQSSVHELRPFAQGIQHDYLVVQAAILLPWSIGMVEGFVKHINFRQTSNVWVSKF
jgi:hypothetical protein